MLLKAIHRYVGMVGGVAFALSFIIPFAIKRTALSHALQTQPWLEKFVHVIWTGATILSAFLILYVFIWWLRFMWARIFQMVEPPADVLWD